jgi:hypothetical protein
MRRSLLLIVLIALTVGCWSSRATVAVARETAGVSPDPTVPGTQLAHTLSEITGVAISPLLGVSVVGAWQYFHAQSPQQRARLPWFAQPWFWIPALVLVGACFLKDTLGLAAPRLLKKPLDVADAITHKISGLIATGAFVPLIIAVFPPAHPDSAWHSSHGFLAAIDPSWLGNGLLVPAAMFAFFIVFLASNAINVLILLSPFAIMDAALKGFRLLVLLTVTVTAFVNPWLGAVWALTIIFVAYFIAGWSLRLSHLGTVFVWDFVTRRRRRFRPQEAANRVFLARRINQVQTRTYGKLLRGEHGGLFFKYRPWLVLRERVLGLPGGEYAVAQGLLYSQVMRIEGPRLAPAILLPPRYRGHETELVALYGLAGVRDAGLRAAFRWLKELLGFRLQAQATG